MKNLFNIEKLDDFGRGVSHFNGKVVFVENALKGEVVECEITNDKKNFMEGFTTGIIEESADRKKAECPYYGECGGCNIMHLKYIKELEYKKEKVSYLLSKFARIDNSKIKEIIASPEYAYRNKIRLKVKTKIGLYKSKSFDLVPIDKCLICSDKINEIIFALKDFNFEGIDEVVIRSAYDNKSMVVLMANKEIDKKYYIDNLEKYTDTLVLIKEECEEVLFGDGYIIEKLGNLYFRVSPNAFFQVNTTGAEKLYNVIKKYAELNKNDTLLDLYCGTGTIGMFLSDNAKKVIGIEINFSAYKDALFNKKLNGINNINFINNSVDMLVGKSDFKNANCLIVDPPRSGLGKKALKNILSINSPKIIYISCNPVTLARDLNALKEYYEVSEITLVDMFPNTYHVECVTLLSLKEN